MTTLGIDLLGRRGWAASSKPGGECLRRELQANVPSAILPYRKQEPLVAGKIAENHRRGRGLPWPPEAQVPVLGRTDNGAGRVPLAAVFELIAMAEVEWGKLGDHRIAWKPEGKGKVEVNAARVISAHVADAAGGARPVGLVVPDSLGTAGQQEIINSCVGLDAILIPRSIAAVLAWCRQQGAGLVKSTSRNGVHGYLLVVDAAFGHWSVNKVPICTESAAGKAWLLPLHIPRLKRTKLPTTGWSVLLAALGQNESHALGEGWAADILDGRRKLPRRGARGLGVRAPGIASLLSLEGKGELGPALIEVSDAAKPLLLDKGYGECLGTILTGPLSSIVFEDAPLRELVRFQLNGQSVFEMNDTSAADGAAHAAYGLAHGEPTWLEEVEPLDLYYIGKSDLGDAEQKWLPLLEARRLNAGSEYHNAEPIGGLKLQSGHDCVEITLRRPKAGGGFEYRKISTTQGKKSSADIPLLVNVTARPGQGFAEVRVASRERGLFDSQLDWQKLEACDEPEKPKLAYIPKAAELLPVLELWHACGLPLEQLLEVLQANESPDQVIAAARAAVKKLNRALLAEKHHTIFGVTAKPDEFQVYTPMGREGKPPTAHGVHLLDQLADEMKWWMERHYLSEKAHQWLCKVGGWWYLGCPRAFVGTALSSVTTPGGGRISASDLHVVGLCLEKEADLRWFFRSYCREMPVSRAPNNWLKALRNIVKYNEHALREANDELACELFEKTTEKLEQVLDTYKPLIAQNAIETLTFLLKRRRYQSGFASVSSGLHLRALDQAERCSRSGVVRPRGKEFARTFIKFLSSEGNMSDIGTLLVDDDEDGED